jgi:hypothetical protein
MFIRRTVPTCRYVQQITDAGEIEAAVTTTEDCEAAVCLQTWACECYQGPLPCIAREHGIIALATSAIELVYTDQNEKTTSNLVMERVIRLERQLFSGSSGKNGTYFPVWIRVSSLAVAR